MHSFSFVGDMQAWKKKSWKLWMTNGMKHLAVLFLRLYHPEYKCPGTIDSLDQCSLERRRHFGNLKNTALEEWRIEDWSPQNLPASVEWSGKRIIDGTFYIFLNFFPRPYLSTCMYFVSQFVLESRCFLEGGKYAVWHACKGRSI